MRSSLRDRMSHEVFKSLRRNGFSYREIGEVYGVTAERVRQVYGPGPRFPGDHGITRPPPWPDHMIERARALWNEGGSVQWIAGVMNTNDVTDRFVTKNMVIGIAHRHDFPPRPSPILRPKPITGLAIQRKGLK